MSRSDPPPPGLPLLLIALAAQLTGQREALITYLLAENAVWRQRCTAYERRLDIKRPRFTQRQRARLARAAQAVGRQGLLAVHALQDLIVTPDTLLTWWRQLQAAKWTYPTGQRRPPPGRPATARIIVETARQMAEENDSWGYGSIVDRLAVLGFTTSKSTVARILRRNGLLPAPLRKQNLSWRRFLKAHWATLFATDLTTVEVWTPKGLVTHYVMAVMHLATREVRCAGITTNPHGSWMRNITRGLLDPFDGFLRNATHVIVDRGGEFLAFRDLVAGDGKDIVLTPAQAPNANAHLERWFRSFKEECLERMIPFGEQPLWRIVRSYVEHHNRWRTHQGLDGGIPQAAPEMVDEVNGNPFVPIVCRSALGGMLTSYYRQAA